MCLLSIFENQINQLTTDRFLVQHRKHLKQFDMPVEINFQAKPT